jgi:hypothetical protein
MLWPGAGAASQCTVQCVMKSSSYDCCGCNIFEAKKSCACSQCYFLLCFVIFKQSRFILVDAVLEFFKNALINFNKGSMKFEHVYVYFSYISYYFRISSYFSYIFITY